MHCFICKGDMKDDITTHVSDLGNCIIIIRNVPCKKCTQCGEIIYTGDIENKIEKIIDTFENALTEIAVVDFQNKIA